MLEDRIPQRFDNLVRMLKDAAPARLGRYELVKPIGRGGMGDVWHARDTELGRDVALKLLRAGDPTELDRFQREARTAAKLAHPNIAAVYEVAVLEGPDGPRHAIAMQLIEGMTLSTAPRDNRKSLVRLIRDAALAVDHAHRHGVVHRDLKPANLMVSGDRVYVMDFGLAKSADPSISATGTILGTPAYMPPEQAAGRPADARSDVYGLGATLYELVTDRPPFRGATAVDVLRRVLDEDPKPPAVEADLSPIILKCLEKDPTRRYATAAELADDLTRWLDGEPVRARPPSFARVVGRRMRRHPWAVVAILILAVGIATTVVLSLRVSTTKRVADLLSRAERLYAAGDIDGTRRLATEAASLEKNAEADFWLARLDAYDYQLRRGVPEARIIHGLVELIPQRPENDDERRLRERVIAAAPDRPVIAAIVALFKGDLEAAIAGLSTVASDDPGRPDAEVFGAVARYLKGDFEGAEPLLIRHRGTRPALVLPILNRTLIAIGHKLELAGRGAEASTRYLQAHAAATELPSVILASAALTAQARLDFNRGRDPEETLARALAGLSESSEKGEALLVLAEFRASRGRVDPKAPREFDDALAAFDRAPRDGAAILGGLIACLERGRFLEPFGLFDRSDAVKRAQAALKHNPDFVEAAIVIADDLGDVARRYERRPEGWAAFAGSCVAKADKRPPKAERLRLQEQALDAYDRALKLAPGSVSLLLDEARACTALGTLAALSGEDPADLLKRAADAAKRASDINPESAWARAALGDILLTRTEWLIDTDAPRRYEEARKLYDEALARNPSAIEFLLRRSTSWRLEALAVSYTGEAIPRLDSALKEVERALEINPRHVVARVERAEILLAIAHAKTMRAEKADYGAVLAAAGEIVAEWPAYSRARIVRAAAQRSIAIQQKPEEVLAALEAPIADLQRVVEASPEYGEALQELGMALRDRAIFCIKLGRDPLPALIESRDAYRRASRLSSISGWKLLADVAVRIAERNRDVESLKEAVDVCDRALARQPGDADALQWRAQARIAMAMRGAGEPAIRDALADINAALKLMPSRPILHNLAGEAHFILSVVKKDLDELEAAVRAFAESARLDPTNAETARLLIKARYSMVQRGRDAAEQCRRIIEETDRYLKAWPAELQLVFIRAQALDMLSRREEAEAGYSDVLKMEPNHAGALFGRGAARVRLGRREEGEKDLRRSVEISPALKDAVEKLLKGG